MAGKLTGFIGKARPLTADDFAKIGAMIGVGVAELRAVVEVETSGSGFDASKRPKMLFEPHVFYREIAPAKRAEAVSQGLAYAKWRPKAYPKDSYPRMAAAIALDRNAALRSASWGLGQIMGFNATLAGYETAEQMVAAFLDGEAEHLCAMCRFIAASGLADELRRHDWAGFARGYNGAGYAANGYDKDLAEAYARWAAKAKKA